MNVFELFAKLSLDDSGYEKGLKGAQSSASKFASKVGGGLKTAAKVGSVAVASLGAAAGVTGKKVWGMAKESAAFGDQIDKDSQKLGLSRKAYQEWDYVLSQSGVEITSMTTGLKTMTNQVAKAKKGSADATANFEKLGISTKELKTLSREEIFEKTIKGLQGMKDSTDRAALANTLFGRSGQNLTPLFNTSAKSVDELRQKANDLGFVMSDKAVNGARDFTDSLDTLKRTFTGIKNNVMGELLPSFSLIMNGLSDLLAGNDKASEKLEKGFSDVVKNFTKIVPKIISVVGTLAKVVAQNAPEIIRSLATGIVQAVPELLTTITEVLPSVFESLVTSLADLVKLLFSEENIATLAQNIMTFATNAVNSFVEILPEVIPTLVSGIGTLISTIFSGDNFTNLLTSILTGFATLLSELAKSLPELLVTLVQAIPSAISSIITAIGTTLPQFIQGAIQLIIGLVEHLPEIILALVDAIPTIIDAIIDGFIGNIDKLVLGAVELVIELVKHLPEIILGLIKAIPKIVMSLVNGFIKFVGKFTEVGKRLIEGLWQGIANAGKWLWDQITGFFGGIVDGIKDFFGIKSPSRLFRDQIGKQMARGLGIGFVDEMKSVSALMQDSIPTDFDIDPELTAPEYSTELLSVGAASEKSAVNQTINIEINNPQLRDDTDVDDIVNKIDERLGELFRQRSIAYG